MNIKVIILDGIVVEVLSDGQARVEIVGIDKDCKDYNSLCKYEENLHKDPNLKSIPFTVAHFEDNDE